MWLDDRPVAVLGAYQGEKIQYVLADHLGTPRAVVNPATDAIIWRWDLTGSAFGSHAGDADPDGDGANDIFNLRYPGQYADESGLHYNYFCDYDPATGRYVQSDPIGLGGGISTYGYVSARPLSGVDPLGLFMEYCRDKSILRIRFHVKVFADKNAQARVDEMLRLAGDAWTGSAELPGVFGSEVAFVHTEVVRSNLPAASPLRVSSSGGFTPSSGTGGRGTWHLGMSRMSIAHETGHFFGNGLWDAHFNYAESYVGTSIMVPKNLEDMDGPTARDFATLLNMFRRNSKDCSCTAW